MKKEIKELKAQITLLELKREYLSFTNKDQRQLEELKQRYSKLIEKENFMKKIDKYKIKI